MKRNASFLLRLIFGLLSFLLGGCSSSEGTSIAHSIPGTFTVDIQLKEFYVEKGGEEVFGPAIAEVTLEDYLRCQLMANARICVNTNLNGSAKYSLSPLGSQLGIPLNKEVESSAIFPDFIPLIGQLGEENIGRPLDMPRYNYEEGRIEQYFGKVGFYIDLRNPDSTVKLLPYGDKVCGNTCPYIPPVNFDPILDVYNSSFTKAIQMLGGEAFSGIPLTPEYTATDGNLEQVFTNIVVFADASNQGAVMLRPVPSIIGVHTGVMVEQQYDITDNMVFVRVEGDLGYHIPIPLDNYISMHGGLAVSGNPINEISPVADASIFRQCFQTYCLDYDPNAREAYKTLPAALGREYLEVVKPVIPGGIIQPEDVLLETSVAWPRLSVHKEQVISIHLQQKYSGQAVPGIQAALTLRTPDGSLVYEGDLPSTDENGNASLTLEVMTDKQNGDLLFYQVCLQQETAAPVCINGSFLIWD